MLPRIIDSSQCWATPHWCLPCSPCVLGGGTPLPLLCGCASPLLCANEECEAAHVVNFTGNPQVFIFNLYPYLRKPVTRRRGKGFDRYRWRVEMGWWVVKTRMGSAKGTMVQIFYVDMNVLC
jgi:hypothetical protein